MAMTATESIAEFSEQPTWCGLMRLFTGQTREIVASANVFRRWTREHLILREPNEAELKEHDRVCKTLIRVLQFGQIAVSDPIFPDKSLAEEVAFAIRRLTEDWEMLHNPMPEAEARKLIPDLFAA
jgi:hypothetical protein